jgi:hypothetical protein
MISIWQMMQCTRLCSRREGLLRGVAHSWKISPVVARHLLKAFEPFSIRALRDNKAKGANVSQAARAMIGITPAPAYVTRTAEQQRAMETATEWVASFYR